MPELCRGRIVWVEVSDPQERNRKCRPAVIVSPDSDIGEGAAIWVVALSTQIDASAKDLHVDIPWHRAGHPRTGLKTRCVAVCNWLEKVQVADIQELAGVVPGRQLLDILTRIKLPGGS